jgi:hypothetical protein
MQNEAMQEKVRLEDRFFTPSYRFERSGSKIKTEQPMKIPLSVRLTLPRLAVASVVCVALSLLLAGCQTISGYSQVSLVRVIDASYNAPAVNVYVEGSLIASNIGEGSITTYGGFAPTDNAKISITAATSDKSLVTTNGTLSPGLSQSLLITDINAEYQVQVLKDQSTPAPSGHSAFRLINEAPSTGPVDVYFLPGTSNQIYATAKPVIIGLPIGAVSGYVIIPSSTLYMVIAPTGTTLLNGVTTIYTSAAFPLVGGEVRTVLIVDPQLATEPVVVYIADDVN